MKKNWNDLADAFAFVGNSLLLPMNQTAAVGLSPAFWEAFPHFDSPAVEGAADALAQWAQANSSKSEEDAVRDVSVEYTKLFVGPPSPQAAPWETMNGATETTVGFGEPTFQMKQLLREAGLEVSNSNNQYEDHMGIELLYASELARRAAQEADDQQAQQVANQLRGFLAEHPLKWVDTFAAKVQAAAPGGYFERLLALAKALMLVA